MARPEDSWTVSHFGQSNPDGAGQGSVPALLRRVADTLDELGDIDVQDLVFHSEPTADEDRLCITVYYHRADADGQVPEPATPGTSATRP